MPTKPVRIGMKAVGPSTAIVLLDLWREGKQEFTLMELRWLIKVISEFLEAIEEAREWREPQHRYD